MDCALCKKEITNRAMRVLCQKCNKTVCHTCAGRIVAAATHKEVE